MKKRKNTTKMTKKSMTILLSSLLLMTPLDTALMENNVQAEVLPLVCGRPADTLLQPARARHLAGIYDAIARQPEAAADLIRTAQELAGEAGDMSLPEAQVARLQNLTGIYNAMARQPELMDHFVETAELLVGPVGETTAPEVQISRLEHLSSIYEAISNQPQHLNDFILAAKKLTGGVGNISSVEGQMARLNHLSSIYLAIGEHPQLADELVSAAIELTGEVGDTSSSSVQLARLESFTSLYKALALYPDSSAVLISAAERLTGQVGETSTPNYQMARIKSLSGLFESIVMNPSHTPNVLNAINQLTGPFGDTSALAVQVARMESLTNVYKAMLQDPDSTGIFTQLAEDLMGPLGDTSSPEIQAARVKSLTPIYTLLATYPNLSDTFLLAANRLMGAKGDVSSTMVQEARLKGLSEIYSAIMINPDLAAELIQIAEELTGVVENSSSNILQLARLQNVANIYPAIARQPEAAATFVQAANRLTGAKGDLSSPELQIARAESFIAIYEAIARQPEAAGLIVDTAKELTGDVGDLSSSEGQAARMMSLARLYDSIARQPEMGENLIRYAEELVGQVGDTSSPLVQAARLKSFMNLYPSIARQPEAIEMMIRAVKELTGEVSETSSLAVQLARAENLSTIFESISRQPEAAASIVAVAKELTGNVSERLTTEYQMARLMNLQKIYESIARQPAAMVAMVNASKELMGGPVTDGLCIQEQPIVFGPQFVGYPSVPEKVIEISKRRIGTISNLEVNVSGPNPGAFILGEVASSSLTDDQPSTTFTIKPAQGLAAGRYSATVTITADDQIKKTIYVSFTVQAAAVEQTTQPKEHLPVGTTEDGKINAEYQNVVELLRDSGITKLVVGKDPFSKAVQNVKPGESVVIETKDWIGDQKMAIHVPAESLLELAKKNASLSILIGSYGTKISASRINLDQLAAGGVPMSDIFVIIEIEKATAALSQNAEKLTDQKGIGLVSAPVTFKMKWKSNGEEKDLSTQRNLVMQTIPFTEGSGVISQQLAAVVMENGKLYPVPAIFKEGKATIFSRRVGTVMVVSQNKTFEDIQNHWSKEAVDTLANKMMVSGRTAKTFRPSAAMTRAEFTSLLIRSLGMESETVLPTDRFSDISTDEWYSTAVTKAVGEGLFPWVKEEQFSANQPITREEIIATLQQASVIYGLKLSESTKGLPADFNKTSDWAKDSLRWGINAEIILGKTDGTLAPTEIATRAQGTVMVWRFLKNAGLIN